MSVSKTFQLSTLLAREVEIAVMSMCVAQFFLRNVGMLPSLSICKFMFVRKASIMAPLEFVSGDPHAGWWALASMPMNR